MKLPIVDAKDRVALAGLYRRGWEAPAGIRSAVREIIGDVRRRGDEALVEYSRRLDFAGYNHGNIRFPLPMHEQAKTLVSQEIALALALARERVAAFHSRQLQPDIEYVDDDGTSYAFRRRPLASAAAYVPGGTAALASSVIMTVVPAKVAGVSRVVVLTPPQKNGGVPGAVVFACWLCGVDELYVAGGAHGIAAAAYGTQTIAPVDKIVGPGNVWVTEAKRQVFGVCGVDGLAGPSEVLVVADDSANPGYVAGELLAQAEHDPLARVAAVSESEPFLVACAGILESLDLESLPRGETIRSVLEHGTYLIHARRSAHLFKVIERFAPEHLSLQVADPSSILARAAAAGAVFVGPHTPVACGDYLAGTNHVLPTSGAARFASGLSVADFQRSYSVLRNSPERMKADAPVIAALAQLEGLERHAETARMRQGED
jgi:histidinol dehydrogenase